MKAIQIILPLHDEPDEYAEARGGDGTYDALVDKSVEVLRAVAVIMRPYLNRQPSIFTGGHTVGLIDVDPRNYEPIVKKKVKKKKSKRKP